MLPATPDGIAFDEEGNLWITLLIEKNALVVLDRSADIHTVVEDPEGIVLGRPTNVSFGGDDMCDLYVGSLDRDCVLHTRVDIPGYLLDRTDLAMQIIERAARPNIRLQFDIYHVQIMEGDLARSIERLLPSIGHIQLADNPGRNEPGTGEIHYEWLLQRIDALGYEGWIGCEYKPRGQTVAGLSWAKRFLA